MGDKIRLAVIGTGMAWDRLHLPAIQELADKYEIMALANPTLEKLQKAADKIGLSHDNIYQDYKEMLKREDIDVVNVAVPISMNYLVAKDVAEAGKNMIAEKPIAPNLEEAVRFLELPKQHHINIMIAENYRYNEENSIIKNLVEQKRIGDVLYFIKNNARNYSEMMKENSYEAKDWRQHPDYPGGDFLDASVHDIAAFRYIFGEVSKVSAFGKEHEKDFCPYSNINANMLFQSGIIGHFSYCNITEESQKPAVGLRIIGTNGMIYLEDKTAGVVNIFYNDGSHEMINFRPKRGYYNEFLNYYNAFINKEDISVTPFIEFGDTKLIFAILESAKEQKVIHVDKSNEFIAKMEGIKKFIIS